MLNWIRHKTAAGALSLFSVLVLTLAISSDLFVYSLFKLAQENIAENHCEMSHVPGSDCEGSCYLKEALHGNTHPADEGSAPIKEMIQAPQQIIGMLPSFEGLTDPSQQNLKWFSHIPLHIRGPYLDMEPHPPKG